MNNLKELIDYLPFLCSVPISVLLSIAFIYIYFSDSRAHNVERKENAEAIKNISKAMENISKAVEMNTKTINMQMQTFAEVSQTLAVMSERINSVNGSVIGVQRDIVLVHQRLSDIQHDVNE